MLELASWPWPGERRTQSGQRYRILSHDHDRILEEFLQAQWLPENVQALGKIDTSFNPLSTFCAALSSPGLYGKPPAIEHPDPNARPLIATGGLLDHAAWAATMQRAEYFARGLGAVALRPYLGEDNALRFELVYPHDLHVEVDPRDPMRPVRLYQLRCYHHAATREMVHAFDVYDLTDPANPRFYVCPADKDKLAVDIGSTLTPPIPSKEGDAYPWRYQDGRPFIPHVVYRTDPTDFWGAPRRMSPLARATLTATALATLHTFDAAVSTFPRIITVGCKAISSDALQLPGKAVHSVALTPSAMLYLEVDADVTSPQVIVIPGRNPSEIFKPVQEYQANAFASAGLHVPDTTRSSSGNPTSAAALQISDVSRREEQQRMAPILRPSDLELLGKTAATLNRVAGTAYPESGYSVSYHVLPATPDERAATVAEAETQYAQGLISKVALYQAYHPGTDSDGALQALVRAAQEQQQLDALLPKPPAPKPPTPSDPSPTTPEDPDEGEE